MRDTDYSAAAQLSPSHTTALLVVANLLLAFAFAFAVLRAMRHARRARAAAASVSRTDPRSAGHAVLHGTVETEHPERPAVIVTIQERGEQRQHKGRWSHTWKEFDRDVRVEPFDLLLASGTRVRVEPDPDVFLIDKLELTKRGNPRTRQARLEHGEVAYVDGMLASRWRPPASAAEAGSAGEGLYRGAPSTGFVLTNGVDRMLISTEPLQLRHQRRSRTHRIMALVFSLAFIVMNTALFGQALLVNMLGEDVDARIVATRSWVTINRGSHTRHYGVVASYVDPITGREVAVESEVSHRTHYEAARGQPIPFRVVRRWPGLVAVGTGATLGPLAVTLTALLLAMLPAGYVLFVRHRREWFDHDIIEEHGSGELQY